ncbi:tetratricopeptide repeat protein [Streptomyces sp. TRM66268-LWL]|uniref:Tetratricopeptide repeat protein n=1 Tax=Streptomyces polyasparticus TaxID=2767826 RepID=A0ABR7SM81_9ACTN|nr:tetratricopeptide repeat protein [Streptomyces polyasparticus]MBC9716600.1 tetratricopeptide repeat protein [Streptomyces polyasparticus]
MEQAEAGKLVGRAQEAWDREEWLEAAQLYERVLAHYPDEEPSAAWWYDAALAYKFLRNWAKAHELGREAAARAPRGAGDPAYWNLGIAATVRRDWATARDAWQGFGIRLPDGEGEITADFGVACVRLDTGGEQEVVWVRRLCPTRGRVLNVPATKGRRFGEIVVHDGVPNGERTYGKSTVAVFDELLLLEPSELPTLHVTVHAPQAADLDALVEAFSVRELGAEPAGSFHALCSCCSTGTVDCDEQAAPTRAGTQKVWLAAPEAEARELLDDWAAQDEGGRSWSGLQSAEGHEA